VDVGGPIDPQLERKGFKGVSLKLAEKPPLPDAAGGGGRLKKGFLGGVLGGDKKSASASETRLPVLGSGAPTKERKRSFDPAATRRANSDSNLLHAADYAGGDRVAEPRKSHVQRMVEAAERDATETLLGKMRLEAEKAEAAFGGWRASEKPRAGRFAVGAWDRYERDLEEERDPYFVKWCKARGIPKCVLTLVPIRPRRRGERRSLRTFAGVSLRPGSLAFNPRPRCLSTPSDAFQLHPDVRSTQGGGLRRRRAHARVLRATRGAVARRRPRPHTGGHG
jgi:hypothetical protein